MDASNNVEWYKARLVAKGLLKMNLLIIIKPSLQCLRMIDLR